MVGLWYHFALSTKERNTIIKDTFSQVCPQVLLKWNGITHHVSKYNSNICFKGIKIKANEKNLSHGATWIHSYLFSVSSSFLRRFASSRRLCNKAIFSLSEPSWLSFNILFSCWRRISFSLNGKRKTDYLVHYCNIVIKIQLFTQLQI